MLKNIVAAVICLFLLLMPQNKSLIFKNADYYIFAANLSSGEIITAKSGQALQVKSSLKRVSGESAVYLESVTAASLIKEFNAKIVFVETVGDTISYYCYSPKIYDAIYVSNKKINLHICQNGSIITAGSPIIFSSY